MAFHNNP